MMALGLEFEISGFGIKHYLIEPDSFSTKLLSTAAYNAKYTDQGRTNYSYEALNDECDSLVPSTHGDQLGDR